MMENWINQIYISLVTGLFSGILSSFLVLESHKINLFSFDGFLRLAIIFLVLLIVWLVCIILYWVVFERKRV